MDPKSSAQLDPKLQEAYNKIMGVSLTDAQASTPPASSPSPTPTDPMSPTTPTIDPTPAASPAPLEPVIPTSTPIDSPANNPTIIPIDNMPPLQPSPQSTPQASPNPPTEQVITPSQPEMATVENTASLKPHAFVAKNGSAKISPVILIVGGIVFLILYTIIWIKVFNIPVPYINQ